jgi:signal transduction histidine kinase
MVTLIYRLLMLFLLLIPRVGSTAPILLDRDKVNVFPDAQFFIDKTNKLTIQAVMQDDMAAAFTPFERGRVLFGDSSVWIKVMLHTVQAGQTLRWLEVTPASVEKMTLYMPMQDGRVVTAMAGKDLPFSMRQVPYRHVVFPVMLEGQATQTLYLKVESRFSGVRQLLVWTPQKFHQEAILTQLAWGAYLGICVLLILSSWWFEREIRDGVYRSFALLVSSSVVMILAITGLLYEYIAPWSQTLQTIPYIVLTSLACYFFGLDFYFRFVGMQRTHPRLMYWYLGFIRVSTILLAIGVMTEYGVQARKLMIIMISFVYVPSAVLVLWKPFVRGDSEVKLTFFVTSLTLGSLLFVNYFVSMGYIAVSGIVEYRIPLVLLMIFLVIYYAISRRYKRMREDKEHAQKQKLHMVVHAEQEVVRQVAVKTHDLNIATRTIEQVLSTERGVYRAQKSLLDMVSHELRTPLAVIDAATINMLRETGSKNAQIQASLVSIQQATDYLSGLLHDQSMSGGGYPVMHDVTIRHIALQSLFEEAVAAARPLAIQHIFSISPYLPKFIDADIDLMRLVLRALLDNVVRQTPAGTVICLNATSQQDGWYLDILGQPLVQIDAYFEVESRSPAYHAESLDEDALSISLARQLMAAQHGRLQDGGMGALGACFRIVLPFAG